SYPDLEPRLFSFNSPVGACPKCNGLGVLKQFDRTHLILDDSLSLEEGAIPLLLKNAFLFQMTSSVAKAEKIKINTPLKSLTKAQLKLLLEGSDQVYSYKFESENSSWNFKKEYPGIIPWLEKKYNESESEKVRGDLEEFMHITPCADCQGDKLNPFARAVTIADKSIMDISRLSIEKAADFFESLSFEGNEAIIAQKILKEIKDRLRFLLNVGLSYLTLNRDAVTLSGGESQRIRLATQIGSALSGVLYVLDEPSIGLHQRDNQRLIETLIDLKNIGNTVLVVEHDEDTMRACDYLIDMGPSAGIHGGEVVAFGKPEDVYQNSHSITGQYLSGKKAIPVPKKRRNLTDKITINKARENNLKDLTVSFPLGG